MKKEFTLSRDTEFSFAQKTIYTLLNAGALFISLSLVGGVEINKLIWLLLLVWVLQVVASVLQPLFGLIGRKLGVLGLLAIGFFGYGLVLWLTLQLLLKNSDSIEFWPIVVASWLYALLITIINWAFVATSEKIYKIQLLRSIKVKNRNETDKPGYIFIQLDGVSAPVLDWQLKAGNLPNIAALLREEKYMFRTWHTGLPATTPASQAGILFGSNANIPAFRWYEKKSKQLVVANQTEGAKLIESRLSRGNGLLSNGGVSIGNLFSGDAETNIMVMSKMSGERESLQSMRQYSSFFSTPHGFMRSIVLAIGEIIKELYQARRQKALNIQPRIERKLSYVFLRAATNVLMRDMQTSIVIENMLKGVNSIYVDFLDYDEIAHHAGIARAESLASLSGLDKVVGLLYELKSNAPRPYEIILLSDHGQSQGRTFKQLHNGKSLEDFVKEFTKVKADDIQSSLNPIEEDSVTRNLLYARKDRGVVSRKLNKELEKSQKANAKNDSEIVITGSGNLGNIWLNAIPNRATISDIKRTYPKLLPSLVRVAGIGFIIVQTDKGPVCINGQGSIQLNDGKVTGVNPISNITASDYESLRRLSTMANAPDIIVLSTYDESTQEVHAFEELVGNHGGLGGWQTEAILLHPSKLTIPTKYTTNGLLYGAENVHKILKNWVSK